MTPKEKARELVDKMFLQIPSVYDPTNLPHYPIAKQCALIHCQEMINEISDNYDTLHAMDRIIHYENVKTEINNL
jgi:hypothetical protein